jgi:hypothetical protein
MKYIRNRVARDIRTGRLVTAEYASRHPTTTVMKRIRVRRHKHRHRLRR